MDIDVRTLVEFGAKYTPLIAMGQWWRLVTAGFLHGGLFHILMNAWVLFDLGAQVEEVYGASRMWVIYLVSSVFGFYISAVWNPAAPSVGASAALFGLIGAMIALGVRHRTGMGAAIRGMYIRWAVYGLLFSLFPGIDMAAHVGGLVAGFVIAYAAGLPRYEGSWTERGWRIAAWVLRAGDRGQLPRNVHGVYAQRLSVQRPPSHSKSATARPKWISSPGSSFVPRASRCTSRLMPPRTIQVPQAPWPASPRGYQRSLKRRYSPAARS